MAVGERTRTMDLGRMRGNRQVYLLGHHEHLEGNNRVRALVDDGVITNSGSAKTHCLNLTSTWSTEAIGSIAGTPLLLSTLSCMVWPIVAVLKYGADVQTSVQTGVTIAGFIVTASESDNWPVMIRQTDRVARCVIDRTRCFSRYHGEQGDIQQL